jgi:hypothetical protein
VTSEDELRALLVEIAASAGDPPEHGLEGVAARRRRRTRRRRGAVATAAALAVLGVASLPWLSGIGDDQAVTTAAESDDERRRAELPDIVEVHCTPQGIDVPVGSIRPQRDGMHLLVNNGLSRSTHVRVVAEETASAWGWDSGRIEVAPGRTELIQPVPPGILSVGCEIGGREPRRRVDLVDVDRLWEEPALECQPDDPETQVAEPATLAAPVSSYITATTLALEQLGYWMEDDQVRPLEGYPRQRFVEETLEPVARVLRGGDAVALVALADQDSEDDDAGGPWVSATLLTACDSFLEGIAAPDTTATDDD